MAAAVPPDAVGGRSGRQLRAACRSYLSVAAARAAVIREEAPPLPRIELPTRIMWGRHDPILKVEWVDRLPEYFVAPEITIAEDAGHFVHYGPPDEASAAIAAFFDRVGWR